MLRITLACVISFVTCLYVMFSKHEAYDYSDPIYKINPSALGELDDEKVLYFYNWIDYIDPVVIDAFEKITGVKVVLDVFDSNETLEVKLLAGNSGYDLVVPSATPYFSRQLQANVYQKLDKSRLITTKTIDPFFMEHLATSDINNEYALPYLWGLSGIAVNVSQVLKMYPDATLDSWALIFDETHLKKISRGHVELSDSPAELFPAIQKYLGNTDKDFDDISSIEDAGAQLKKIRPHIFKFNSSAVQDLFNGTACVAMGTSGDIRKILIAAKKNGDQLNIQFVSPKEGSALWIDVFAIPNGARHPKNAHAFINFVLHPLVIAKITNYTGCANAVPTSIKYINPEIANDNMVYPDKKLLDKSYIEAALPPSVERVRTRLFTKIKSEVE